MGAKWGTLGPWKAQTEVAAIALNQKVVDRFLKVCAEGEVARQGAWPQCPVSPLLSPLLISSSFFSLNLSQVFFPSLYLFFFLFSSLLLSIISFLFPSFILPSSFLLSLCLSLSSCLSHFSLPLPFSLPSLSFVSFPLPFLSFSFLLPLFLSVSLFF